MTATELGNRPASECVRCDDGLVRWLECCGHVTGLDCCGNGIPRAERCDCAQGLAREAQEAVDERG